MLLIVILLGSSNCDYSFIKWFNVNITVITTLLLHKMIIHVSLICLCKITLSICLSIVVKDKTPCLKITSTVICH